MLNQEIHVQFSGIGESIVSYRGNKVACKVLYENVVSEFGFNINLRGENNVPLLKETLEQSFFSSLQNRKISNQINVELELVECDSFFCYILGNFCSFLVTVISIF